MDTHADLPDPDDELYDLVERYVDGEMSPEEAAAFDDRVRTDDDLRRILVETMALGTIADEVATPTPTSPARVSTRRPRRAWVAGLLASAAVIALITWSSCPPGRDAVPEETTRGAVWPQAPIAQVQLETVAQRLASSEAHRELAAASPILEEVLPRADLDAVRRLRVHPAIRPVLKRIGFSTRPDEDVREVIALLLVLNDPRLTESHQSNAVGPLQLRVGPPLRPLLVQRALTVQSKGVLASYVTMLFESFTVEDLPLIQELLVRASHLGAELPAQTLLSRLGTLPSEDALSLCFDWFMGRYGDFRHHTTVLAGTSALIIARELQSQEVTERIRRVARANADRWLRVRAAEALLRVENTDVWRQQLAEIATIDDQPGRRAQAILDGRN